MHEVWRNGAELCIIMVLCYGLRMLKSLKI